MSEHPHALPKNKHRRDGQLERLLPQTSAVTTSSLGAMRMSPRPHVSFLGKRVHTWTTADGSAARSGMKRAMQTHGKGGRASSESEPAMSKHKHGWVYNESEKRCHAASSGQRRPKASLEHWMKRSKTGEKSGFLKEAFCICVEAGLLLDLTQIQVKNI